MKEPYNKFAEYTYMGYKAREVTTGFQELFYLDVLVSLVWVVTLRRSIVQLRLRLVPYGVIWDCLAGTLNPIARCGEEAVRVPGAKLICGGRQVWDGDK